MSEKWVCSRCGHTSFDPAPVERRRGHCLGCELASWPEERRRLALAAVLEELHARPGGAGVRTSGRRAADG